MYSLYCGQVQRGLPNRLRRLRGWLLDGLDIDGQVDVYGMRCRHVQHGHDKHGLHNLRRQQLLEHGGRGGDELHGLSDEQCGVCRRDELLL